MEFKIEGDDLEFTHLDLNGGVISLKGKGRVTGRRGSNEHGHGSGSEGAGPRTLPPHPSVHGRFGNREKSGARLSVKASRPSCASSLM